MLAELFPYAHQVFVVFTIIYLLTILGIIAVVVSENRNPVKSLAWVTVLLLVPILGMFLYVFFGRSLKSVHMISRKNRRKLRNSANYTPVDIDKLGLSNENMQEVRLVDSLVEPHFFPDNKIDVFTTGKEKFDALEKDLESATKYIHLQYFIFENDNIGTKIKDILVRKAHEGVKVRVIYDHVGSFHFNMSFFSDMKKEGIEVYPFLKVTFPEFANRVNWRNHRKLVVIDGRVGYVGGMNIADRYVTGEKGQPAWRDTHLRIEGEAVAGLQYSFAVDWNFMNRELLKETTVHFVPDEEFSDGMQMMTGGPTDLWNNLSFVLLRAIGSAKRRVWIQTPYFLPNDSLLKALQVASMSKIDVQLMIPRKPDSKLLRYATYSYVKECLLAGIKIFFYEASMLHSKMVIVDDDFVTTGSTNFDFRSLEHNFECNVLIYGHKFNSRMSAIFEKDKENAKHISLVNWHRRPLGQKVLESLSRLLSPIL